MRHKALIATGTGLIVASVLTLACSTQSWEGQVETSGTFQDVLGEGQSDGRVPLAGIAESEDGADEGELVAVGALEGLKGEVTIFDGQVWLSRVRDGELFTERGRGIGGKATMLVSTRVHEWSEHPVTEDVAAGELADYLRAAAADAGLDTESPFPFRVDGELLTLDAHVIGGDSPMREFEENETPNPAPVIVEENEVQGRIVGFYAEGREGELTHHGTRLHAHVLTATGDDALTAHVEAVGLKAGSVLRLPAR